VWHRAESQIGEPTLQGGDGTVMVRTLSTGLICLLFAGCGGDADEASVYDPEPELRAWVDTAEAYAEDKDRRGLLSMISESYADGRGNDREKVGDIMRIYFMRQQAVAMLTSIDDIVIMGDSAAKVNVTVGMAGTDASALGVRADAYQFELDLEKHDEDWLLNSARWGKAGRDMR
jgi:hypothetical protein